MSKDGLTPQEYIRQCYQQGAPVREIAQTLGITRDAVKNRAARDPLCPPHKGFFDNVIIRPEAHLQGDIPMRDPTQAELSRLREICAERGLPFDLWTIWWDKTKDASICFRNKEQLDLMEEQFRGFLKRLEKAPPKIKKSPAPTKTLGIPANFDVHIGKHCELIRTGREYTTDIAVSRVLQGLHDQERELDFYDVSDILLPLGNDIVHVDNNNNTSTRGTPQDAESSVESQMQNAAELYIRLVEHYAQKRTVWLTHTNSNHDRVAGWSVSQMIAHRFHNDPRVKWTNDGMSQQHRKYFVFGDNLIVFHHGEAKEEKLMGLIENEARLALAQTKRTYVYQGHTHHKTLSRRGINTENIEKDYSALTVVKAGTGAENRLYVETVRSPSEPDAWHSESGYVNLPAVEMFIHDERSQRHRLTHWF